MKSIENVGLADVQAVYDGPEGDLWELLMGEQIHIGGFQSSMDLADRAKIAAEQRGVDLCCCNGAGMRFLVRFRNVQRMTGVDATELVVHAGHLCEVVLDVALREPAAARSSARASVYPSPRPVQGQPQWIAGFDFGYSAHEGTLRGQPWHFQLLAPAMGAQARCR